MSVENPKALKGTKCLLLEVDKMTLRDMLMFLPGKNRGIVVRGATWYPESSTEPQMTATAGTKMLGFGSWIQNGGAEGIVNYLSIFLLEIGYTNHYIALGCFLAGQIQPLVSVSSSRTGRTGQSCIHHTSK